MKSLISLFTLAVLALLFSPASFAEDGDCTDGDNSERSEITKGPDDGTKPSGDDGTSASQ